MEQKVPTLRTPAMEQAYQDMKDSGVMSEVCRLCAEVSTLEFKYWRVIPNRFPYDQIAKRHDMIIPIRHTAEPNEEEMAEFKEIKESYINDTYRYIFEATHRTKSIPSHFHLHLIEIK